MNQYASPVASAGAPAAPVDYAALLSRLGAKDRASLERQVLAYEKNLGAAAAQRWRSLACTLMALAPAGAKLAASNAMQFYIPDGKYRQQVFAFQALPDGAIAVYAPDVLAKAVRAGLLSRNKSIGNGTVYHLAESDDTLMIDALDGRTPNPGAFYKDLTGWNRTAIRITLPAQASDAQMLVTKQLCALAAKQWT